jgi:hypothetical protein
MTGERHRQGLLDTSIVILRRWIDPGELPTEMAPIPFIASIAIAEDLPLCTTNPADFAGLEDLLSMVPVTRLRM